MGIVQANWFRGGGKESWDVDNLSKLRDNDFTSFSGASNRKSGIYFKPDGTRFFCVADTQEVSQYDIIGTAWNISSYTESYRINNAGGNIQGCTLSNDGAKFYYVNVNTNSIHQFSLTTIWDVSARTQDLTTPISTLSRGLVFSTDGLNLYIVYSTKVEYYTLSTAWNVSTKTLQHTLDLSSETTVASNISIRPNGQYLYVIRTDGRIMQYEMSTFFDLSTATLLKTSGIIAGASIGLFMREDGLKAYTTGNSSGSRLVEFDWF